MSIKEMLEQLGLKNREIFMDIYLNPALKARCVRMHYLDKPHYPKLEVFAHRKGIMLYNEITENQ